MRPATFRIYRTHDIVGMNRALKTAVIEGKLPGIQDIQMRSHDPSKMLYRPCPEQPNMAVGAPTTELDVDYVRWFEHKRKKSLLPTPPAVCPVYGVKKNNDGSSKRILLGVHTLGRNKTVLRGSIAEACHEELKPFSSSVKLHTAPLSPRIK